MSEIMQLTNALPSDSIRTQLARIIGSREFTNAPRLSRFLTYLVEEALAGRSDHLKGYTIGVDVFDKPADFDPQTDTIVRVQARALRQKLDRYYTQSAKDDPIHISISKGGYAPTFSTSCDDERPSDATATLRPKVTRKPSIAVLPFDRFCFEKDYDFISLELAEGVISNLSRFSGLSVFSRSTTEKAKLDHMSIAQMYDLFYPDFVLEGSFRIHDDLIETHFKLIDAAVDEVLMTDSIEMRWDAGNINGLKDEMATRIAARIAVEYGPIGIYAQQAGFTGNTIKWITHAWISRYFQNGFQLDKKARDDIETGLMNAVKSDPTSAEAHAALAMIAIEQYRAVSPDVGDPARLDRAMECASLAVRLGPQSAMAHQSMALAYFHARRFGDFRTSVRRALYLNPSHSDMLATFAICFVRLAEWDEAIPLLDRGAALNPLHPNWYHIPKATFLMMTRGPDEAIAEIKKHPMPDTFGFHSLLVWFHVEAGDMDAAKVEKGRLLAAAPAAETFTRRYFDAICLCDEIANRAIAALCKAGLQIAGREDRQGGFALPNGDKQESFQGPTRLRI
ncbi:hypothetical protein [Aquicoccus sp. SU-CL01552]|uniref:tetratricopeptide repeat protein n=1 Tax=Aquicoccus sp. SU-CL01552 TaxID=3127656 RepID=UPI00310A31F3